MDRRELEILKNLGLIEMGTLSSEHGASLIGTHDGITVQSELTAMKSATATADYSRRNAINLASAYSKFKHNEDVTVVCVGDSMTAGFDINSKDKVPPDNGDWATHAPVTYPMALMYILNLYTGVNHRVINRGYSGDTARTSYERWIHSPNAHVAHIMLGINDSGGGHGATFDEYIHYMEKLIQRYVDWGCGVILHTTTPIIFNSVNNHSQYFTQAIRTLANMYGCPVFESDTVVQYSIYDGVYSDNVHFNTQGYNKYGNAVGAFIMAGGWVQPPKLVSGEVHLQNGRGAEGVGYIARSVNLHTSHGSYLNNMSTGPMQDEDTRISYTFFMDTEFMDVYGIGIFDGLNISLSYTASHQYPDDNRGSLAINRITLKSLAGHNVHETTGYLVKPGKGTQHGKYVHLGCLVGRGWKTISVSVGKKLSDVRYFNGLVLRERTLTSVKQISNHTDMISGSLKPTENESYVYQYPYYNFQDSSSTVPNSVSLPEIIYFPLPFALLPYNTEYHYYYDHLPVELTVSSPSGWMKSIIRRIGPKSTDFHIDKISGSNSDLLPKSARIMHKNYINETGELSEINEGWSGPTASLYLAIVFDKTPESYYSVSLNSWHKSAMVTVGV
ncbi:SGNH/GDSL hydrolase family protein [Xenorhabdus beddingii]|uniref:SGNH/GDSL hydrolase family protein n=1 Tax=Xenorhabdus beddingii TaxID=40578 RepID=UPI00111C626E|nr:SGNH/GDSL hydrolase family protein [Xenorhabdus beddingii]